jgi:ribosomal protein L20A (L18A)
MKEFVELMPDTKQCPICSQDLPLTEYGICRARKDGRNLYCKSCIRKKVSESRKAFKAYKSVRHQYVVEKLDEEIGSGHSSRRQGVMRQISKMTPVERVLVAIRGGAKTQQEIRKSAKLGDDEVCDALANLLLWTREVRTEMVAGDRHYVINQPSPEIEAQQNELPTPQVPPRKRDVASSFSAVQDLMPGKKPEGAAERVPGWVAA